MENKSDRNEGEEAGKVNESPCRTQNFYSCRNESPRINVQCSLLTFFLLSSCCVMFLLKQVKSSVKATFGKMLLKIGLNLDFECISTSMAI